MFILRSCLVVVALACWLAPTQSCSAASEIIATGDDFFLQPRPGAGSIVRVEQTIVIDCNGSDSEAWALQIQSPFLAQRLRKGDAIGILFDARTIEATSDYGAINVSAAKQDPWQAIQSDNGFRSLDVPRRWHNIAECFRADNDYPESSVNLSIHVGNQKQRLEIRNLRLVHFGTTRDELLPRTRTFYPGDDDRSWIDQANQQIDAVRRADLTVRVIDAQGQPVSDAIVRVEQQRHQYAFGTFVGNTPTQAGDDARKFREQTKRWFNRVTLPRYWADWGTDTSRGVVQADAVAQWAQSEKFELKTHLLLYPQFIPDRVKKLQSQPDRYRREIETAIDSALERTKDLDCVAWDAINELRDVSTVGDVLGDDYYASVFNKANQAQPNVTWFINEYGIFTGGSDRQKNLQTYIQQIKRIIADGGKVEGIGLQGHYQSSLISIAEVWSILDRLAVFGLPIEVTEFDIDTKDETTQAQYTEDFLTAIFAHPATTGLTTWGFWEGDMWRPDGAMIRTDWSIKPNGIVWQKKIYDDWWTRESVRTNREGQAVLRVMRGRHRVEAEAGGQVRFGEFNVTKEATIVLQLGL